jgi:hypothetical protein
MEQYPACLVCKTQDFTAKENFSFKLNENRTCVSCLIAYWKSLNSTPVQLRRLCAQHNRTFDLFCMNCQILLCGKCMMSHREHEIEDIDNMHNYIKHIKSQIFLKIEKFLQSLEKIKSFLSEFKKFLEVFKKNGDKNEFSLGKSYFYNNVDRYEALLNQIISKEIKKREEELEEYKMVVSRSQRIEKKCISELNRLESDKTTVILLKDLFNSASMIQKISIFLYIKGKKE